MCIDEDSKAYSIKAAFIIGLIGLLKRISVDTNILKPTIKARNEKISLHF